MRRDRVGQDDRSSPARRGLNPGVGCVPMAFWRSLSDRRDRRRTVLLGGELMEGRTLPSTMPLVPSAHMRALEIVQSRHEALQARHAARLAAHERARAAHPPRDGTFHQRYKFAINTYQTGKKIAVSHNTLKVAGKFLKLSVSHDTLKVGRSYLRAALKGNTKTIRHLGDTNLVRKVGQDFTTLGHSGSAKRVGNSFAKFGHSVSHTFNRVFGQHHHPVEPRHH